MYSLWVCTTDHAKRINVRFAPEWLEFENFAEYVRTNLGEPRRGVMFTRVDPRLGYEPGNVQYKLRG